MPDFNELAKNLVDNISNIRVKGAPEKEILPLRKGLGEISSLVDEHLNTLQTLQNDLVRVFRSNNVIDEENINTVEKHGNEYRLVAVKSNERHENIFGKEIESNKKEIDELKKIQAAFKELNKSDLSDSKLDKFRQDLGQEKPQEKTFSQKIKELFTHIFSWRDRAQESQDRAHATASIKNCLTELSSSTASLKAKAEELKPLLDPVIKEKYNTLIKAPKEHNRDWSQKIIDASSKSRKTSNSRE